MLTLEDKYTPKTLSDLVATESIYQFISTQLESGNVLNSLLYGPPGCGKTTVARLIPRLLDYEVLEINASSERGIDVVRNDLSNFVSVASLNGTKLKIVILDEFEGFTQQAQESLKAFIEKHKANVRFILTSNDISRIIPAIQNSRMYQVNFDLTTISVEEKRKVLEKIVNRLIYILESEEVDYNPGDVKKYAIDCFPDIRQTLIRIQANIHNGVLSYQKPTIQSDEFELYLSTIVKKLKANDYVGFMSAVKSANSYEKFYAMLYKKGYELFKPQHCINAVVIIANYMAKHQESISKEINFAALICELHSKDMFVQKLYT